MKSVLHVIDSFDLGGAQEVVGNLATCGNRSEFSHEVAALHGRGIYRQRFRDRGLTVHSLSPHKLVPLYLPALAALLARKKFDILHCHLAASNILAKPLGALARIPVIINHDHNNDALRATNRLVLAAETFSNRFASHVITVSSSCRDFLVDHEGVDPEEISLVLNAIDLGHFRPGAVDRASVRAKWKLPKDAPVVAGVGRLNPQKNLSLFLDAAARLAREYPDVRFLLAGTGPEESLLREKCGMLGLGDRVIFAGYVADARQVYAACDLLVMPSLYEGLPMTLLEAMAMGVPVVASRLDGIAEVVTDGESGLLIASGDADGFAAASARLLQDQELRAKITGSAASLVRERFSAERMAREVEEIYRRCLA
jgi:glycosyltransferase involved in cell wall biosynthesis